MILISKLKKLWKDSAAFKIGLIAALFLLLFIICFSCLTGLRNKTETPQMETPAPETASRDTAVPRSQAGVEEAPDLAETIERFFLMTAESGSDREIFIESFWRWIFGEAGIPERMARNVASSALESPAFIMELLAVLENDPYTYFLVDKQHPLPEGYEPEDLVSLSAGNVKSGRSGLMLRSAAAGALYEMAAAAAADGISFTAGSAYRSAAYQAEVYAREVRTYGQEQADRESARPGKSQHQLGLVVDFAPIDDAFAETPEFRWLSENSGRFGWSVSFPDGYEEVTGYRYESWHYRYVGADLAAFIDKYFEGVQQYALQFIHAWLAQPGRNE